MASLIYVNETRNHAVWFSYLVNSEYQADVPRPIRLRGLDSTKNYQFQEINIYPGTDNSTIIHETNRSGDYLMTTGFDPMINAQRTSVIVEFQLAS
jgi:alpha-galactosidase